MHETKFVNDIFVVLRRTLKEYPGAKPVAVHVRLSSLSHLSAQSLSATFKELSRDTAFRDIQLNITAEPVQILCRKCSQRHAVDKPTQRCLLCGSPDIELDMPREFWIESVELS